MQPGSVSTRDSNGRHTRLDGAAGHANSDKPRLANPIVDSPNYATRLGDTTGVPTGDNA